MYEFQIKLKTSDGSEAWSSVRPNGGDPYQYETAREAWDMARICYPEEYRAIRMGDEPKLRVIEV